MNFYEENFQRAIERVSYPQKDDLKHWLMFYPKGLEIWTKINAPNYDLPYSEAESKQTTVHHRVIVPYSHIPTDAAQAEDFFTEKIFLAFMEICTHELMESFAVDDRRFRHPHERGFYKGSREDIRTQTTKTLWRNHVMWEACALVAKVNPPDYRSTWDKVLDAIVDWDMAVERGIARRWQYQKTYYFNWRAMVKAKFKDGSLWEAMRYSLLIIRAAGASLISGEF